MEIHRHEYQLAGTSDSEGLESPGPPGKRRSLFSTVPFILTVIAGVILVIIVVSTHPYILLASQSSDTNKNAESLSANVTLSHEQLLGSEVNLPEKRFGESLNQSVKDLIHQLRVEVEDKLPHNYMKEDSFLIRWFKARDWDYKEAKEMLLDHLDWREEYEIDSSLEANFTFLENTYPYHADGYDYEGCQTRPVISVSLADIDMRSVAVAGYEREYLRFCFREFERLVRYLTECQAKGSNIKGIYILNVAKFSMRLHACPSCLATHAKYFFGVDDNYPGLINPVLVINVPDIAEVFVDILMPYFSGENRAAIKWFRTNQDEWKQDLLKLVPADQLRTEFGGTKDDLDI